MMQEQLAEAAGYIKGTLKFRWYALIAAWLICLGGWFYVINMPDKYVSTARVQVDTGTTLQKQLKGLAVSSNVNAKINLMRQLMFTQYNLAEIARLADIDTDNMEPIERFGFYNELKKNIKIKSQRRTSIFTISYVSVDPELAKKIVNAVLTVFSEKSQSTAYSDVDSARRFIDEQISEYEVRLRNAEKAKEEFKRINFGLLPENTGAGALGKIDRLLEERAKAQMVLKETASKQEIIKKQLREAITISDSSLLPETRTAEDAQIEQLLAQKTMLLLKYTENHPSIIAIDHTILEWEKRKKANRVMVEEDGVNDSRVLEHPYVTELKKELNNTEAQEASIKSRVTTIEERIVKLEEEQSMRLSIETELKGLNRDYNTLTGNYQKLIQRREQVHISKNIDDQGVSVKFNIADPPNKPLKPSQPKRIILFSAILLGGFAVGFGFAFLIYFIRPTFTTTKQILTHTGLVVLGSVSMQKDDRTNKDRVLSVCFYSSILLLFMIYITLVIRETFIQSGGSFADIVLYLKTNAVTSYIRNIF